MFLSKSSLSLSEFVSAGAIARVRAYFGQGTGAILLDQVACTGTETRLGTVAVTHLVFTTAPTQKMLGLPVGHCLVSMM